MYWFLIVLDSVAIILKNAKMLYWILLPVLASFAVYPPPWGSGLEWLGLHV